MKKIKLIAIAIMAICLASCGGKKNSEEAEENYFIEEVDNSESNSDLSSTDDDTDSYSSSSSSDSQDWDSLLDSYEEYVDEYISYVKKAAKGDMDALSEYPALMEKAEEYSDKMKDAQGEMSSSQWGRYMKITTKMSQAAMELQ